MSTFFSDNYKLQTTKCFAHWFWSLKFLDHMNFTKFEISRSSGPHDKNWSGSPARRYNVHVLFTNPLNSTHSTLFTCSRNSVSNKRPAFLFYSDVMWPACVEPNHRVNSMWLSARRWFSDSSLGSNRSCLPCHLVIPYTVLVLCTSHFHMFTLFVIIGKIRKIRSKICLN